MSESLLTPTSYQVVPITTPPTKDGKYMQAFEDMIFPYPIEFKNGKWINPYGSATHYLAPSAPPQQKGVKEVSLLMESIQHLFDEKKNNPKNKGGGLQHAWNRLREEIEELKSWKAQAMAVMPDFQAIGEALGVGIGQNVHDKILPGINDLKEENERLKGLIETVYLKDHRTARTVEDWYKFQAKHNL